MAGKIPLLLAACLAGVLRAPAAGRALRFAQSIQNAHLPGPSRGQGQVVRWMPWHLNKEGRDKYEKSWLEVKPC